MALTINHYARLCERAAIANGEITPDTSARVNLYDISRHWRDLADATSFAHPHHKQYSEKEVAAAKVVISSITYLRRIKCGNIERLIKDVLNDTINENKSYVVKHDKCIEYQ